MDLLPTFAKWAGALLPTRPIDGHDIRPLLLRRALGEVALGRDGLGYYHSENLEAIRSGQWKLYLPKESKPRKQAGPAAPGKLELYDVRADPHEDHEVSQQNPGVVNRLLALAEELRAEIGDADWPGKGQRPAGHVETARPQRARKKTAEAGQE